MTMQAEFELGDWVVHFDAHLSRWLHRVPSRCEVTVQADADRRGRVLGVIYPQSVGFDKLASTYRVRLDHIDVERHVAIYRVEAPK